jgi:transposase
MVAAVRGGESQRSVARRFGVGLGTLQLWLMRAGNLALPEVDWQDRSHAPHAVRRTTDRLEQRILDLRRELREESALGEYGPAAIRRALEAEAGRWASLPSVRTIARVLERRGALDASRRARRPAPPAGWHLPDVRARQAELDSFDVVEGMRFLGGIPLDVLTGLSLHGALADAWPRTGVRSTDVLHALDARWHADGLPAYAQFDNDTRFIGGWRWPNSIGAVIRRCLALEVVPVFVPPREMGFQAAVEAFNGRWQRAVWDRRPALADLAAIEDRSAAFVRAWRTRYAVRIDGAPTRRPFPTEVPDPRQPPAGRLIFVRRTGDTGSVEVLGLRYPVSRLWVHRLVRAELDLDERRLQFYGLRRREPDDQPLLAEARFVPPERWYR